MGRPSKDSKRLRDRELALVAKIKAVKVELSEIAIAKKVLTRLGPSLLDFESDTPDPLGR